MVRRVPVLAALISPKESWQKLKSSKLIDDRVKSTVAVKLSVSLMIRLSGQAILACGCNRSYEAVRVFAEELKAKREEFPLITARDVVGSEPKRSSSNVSPPASAMDAHKTVKGIFNGIAGLTGRVM